MNFLFTSTSSVIGIITIFCWNSGSSISREESKLTSLKYSISCYNFLISQSRKTTKQVFTNIYRRIDYGYVTLNLNLNLKHQGSGNKVYIVSYMQTGEANQLVFIFIKRPKQVYKNIHGSIRSSYSMGYIGPLY